MSFWGKTKAVSYTGIGLGVAGFGGLLAANGAKNFGYNEANAVLDGANIGVDQVNSYLEGEEAETSFDDFDYSDETIDNVKSGLVYGAVGLGTLYGASRLFRSAGQNW